MSMRRGRAGVRSGCAGIGVRGAAIAYGVTAIMLAAAPAAGQSLRLTKHNLSDSGPGPVKAVTESRICIFCHAPHRSSGQPPLWNRSDGRVTYLVYDSPTLQAQAGQPTGASRLCLSCHDGTIALGEIVSEANQIQFQGGTVFLPPGHSLLDVNLADDHPVSFAFDEALAISDPELVSPSSLPATLPLDNDGQMQCTSCHDSHNNDFGDFLRMSPLFSQLCVGCHQKNGWTGSIHDVSTATWDGSGVDPWPHADGATVAENGCMNCHQAHEAGQPPQLLNHMQEENNCLTCHDGSVGSDINSALSLFSRHPVAEQTGVHQPGEDPLTMPRHVECTDCHNPHAAATDRPPPPAAPGSLRFVDGIDINGNPVGAVSYSYEVCLKCHGDAHGTGQVVTRVINNLNTRQEFNPSGISYHPVAAAGKNPNAPSLIPPWTESSIMSCDDCHSSQSGLPRGPHGSDNRPLLKLNYDTVDFTRESSQAYALCYSCHDRQSILNGDSFKLHKKHIEGEDAPCSTCHDPHGISAGTGTPSRNSHLINFNQTVVFPDPNTGRLEFNDLGDRTGECYLECHGKKHSPKDYKP